MREIERQWSLMFGILMKWNLVFLYLFFVYLLGGFKYVLFSVSRGVGTRNRRGYIQRKRGEREERERERERWAETPSRSTCRLISERLGQGVPHEPEKSLFRGRGLR